MRNHSNFTVVPVPVPVPVPAQRSKRKQIQLAYDCRLDVSQGDVHSVQTGCSGGRFNSRYRIVRKDQETRTLKKFFRATLTRRPYLMHSENSHLCEHREIRTFEGN